MTTTEIEYVDGEILVEEQEPSTVAELVALIGAEMVVGETNSNLRYRNKHPRVYKKVSERIAARFPRPSSERDIGGQKKTVSVSELEHIRLYWKTGDVAQKELVSLFEEIAPAEPLYVKGERGLGGKLKKSDVDFANLCFAQGDDVVEEKVGVIEAMVPGYKVSRDAENAVTPDSLARGIQALNRHLQRQAAKQLKGALGA